MLHELRHSEDLFRQLAENIRDVFWLYDPRKRQRVYVSPAYEELWGRPPGQPDQALDVFLQSIHVEDRPRVERTFNQLVERGGWDEEFRIVRPDGTMRWVHDRGFLIHDAHGEVYRIAGVAKDITERKTAESALRQAKELLEVRVRERTAELEAANNRLQAEISERQRIANELQSSEARLRAIFENQPDCISVVSWAGEVTAMNPAGLAILDAERQEDVIGRPFLEFIHPADREDAQRMHERVCAGEKQTLVFRVVGLRGNERLLETRAVPLQEGGQEISHLAVTRDITERKRAELALRDSERRLRTVLDHAPWTVMTVNRDGTITFINRWNNQRRPEELPGNTCFDHVAPQFHPLMKDALSRAFEQGESWRCDLPSPDGSWWDAQIIPLSRDGAAPSVLWIADDVSERRRADQRLREIELQLAHASRLSTMGEMLAGIAHELNQPLFAIGNFAGASQRTLKDLNAPQAPQLADVRRCLEAIETSVARAGEIMRRLRRFVRRDDGQREKVDLCQVVRDAVEMLAFQAREAQVNIDLELPSAPANVLAVRVEMQQVLVNLIRNGIEAVRGQPPARCWLHVALAASSEDVLISVRDLGVGVPTADAARVFEPFFTTKTDGLGLGLPISKSIVESHGGRIWHEPSAAGGTDFRFVLPRERRNHAT